MCQLGVPASSLSRELLTKNTLTTPWCVHCVRGRPRGPGSPRGHGGPHDRGYAARCVLMTGYAATSVLRGRPRGRLRGTIAPRISNSPPQTPQGSLRSSAPARQASLARHPRHIAFACSTSCGDSAKNSSGFSVHGRTRRSSVVSCPPTVTSRHCIAVITSCSPFSGGPATWSTVTARPSSGVRSGRARGRPLPAQRPADRADRGGEHRAELTELGGQPAQFGIGRLDLGRGLVAFSLVDAVVGIDHHRLPSDSSWAVSGAGPPSSRSPRADADRPVTPPPRPVTPRRLLARSYLYDERPGL